MSGDRESWGNGKMPAHIKCLYRWRAWSGPAKLRYTPLWRVAGTAIVLAFSAYLALLPPAPPGPDPADGSEVLIASGSAGGQSIVGDAIAAQKMEAGNGSKEKLLDDGTQVWTFDDAKMSVKFSPKQRNVQLLKGEALFKVAKDPSRPFSVLAGSLTAIAVGTQFRVHTGDCAWVRVDEGIVRVLYKGYKTLLTAGMLLDVPQDCSKLRKH